MPSKETRTNESSIDERIVELLKKHKLDADLDHMDDSEKHALELKLKKLERMDLDLELCFDMVWGHFFKIKELLYLTLNDDDYGDFSLPSFSTDGDIEAMGRRALEQALSMRNSIEKKVDYADDEPIEIDEFESLGMYPEEYRYQLMQLFIITYVRWMSGVSASLKRDKNPFPMEEVLAKITRVGNSGHLVVPRSFCASRFDPDNITLFKSNNLWIAFILRPDLLRTETAQEDE